MRQDTVPLCAQSRQGFTLIELLVVVAIIGVLLSILLPSLRAAREQAKQLLCITNLRSMGQAAVFYAENNDGLVSRGEYNEGDFGMHFAASLLPGLGYTDYRITELWTLNGPTPKFKQALAQASLLQCPSYPVPEQTLDYVVNAYPPVYERQRSDNINGQQGDGPDNTTAPNVVFGRINDLGAVIMEQDGGEGRIERFDLPPTARDPARKIYITEAHTAMPLPDQRVDFLWWTDTFTLSHLPFSISPRMSNDRRHTGGITALFFDGHAKVSSITKVDMGFGYKFEDRLQLFTQFSRQNP